MRTFPVDWATFAAAALVLLLPLPLLFGRGVHYRELDRPWHRQLRAAVTLPWHWLDLIRSAAGTWLLMNAVGLTRRLDETSPDKFALLLFAGVLCLGVLLQTVICKHPESFHAAFAFVTGCLLVLYPPIVAGLTMVSAITLAFAFRTAVTYFGAASAAVVLFGYYFFPNWLLLAIGAAATFLPLLLPLLFSRNLVLAHRASLVE